MLFRFLLVSPNGRNTGRLETLATIVLIEDSRGRPISQDGQERFQIRGFLDNAT